MLMNKTEFWLMNNPVRRLSLRFEVNKLQKMSSRQKFDSVLEIGCGEGQGTKNIIRAFKPNNIYAIDLDPKMIARATRRVSNKQVKFAVGDAANLSFAKDNSFDAVFDLAIIHHIPDWQTCLKEVYRVLKPGGLFLIQDGSIESFSKTLFGKGLHKILDHPYKHMYTKGQFEDEIAKIGFKINQQAYLKPYLFWKIAEK